MNLQPQGEEREIPRLGQIAVDGAPVSSIVVLAATVMALALIPLSVIIGSGKSFPMSQAIYPLVGWLLGPVGGALACGVGALGGAFIAPHTSLLPPATLLSALLGGLAAGAMKPHARRTAWPLTLGLLFTLEYALYCGWAIVQNQTPPGVVLLGSLIDLSALLLYWLPTRALFARWIGSPDLLRVALGLFFGTWMIAGLSHLNGSLLVYLYTNWPAGVWASMIPVAPFEHLVRAGVGAGIGVAVIAGLRNINLVKPPHALY